MLLWVGVFKFVKLCQELSGAERERWSGGWRRRPGRVGQAGRQDTRLGGGHAASPGSPSCWQDTGGIKPCQDWPHVEQLCRVLVNCSRPFAECHWHKDPVSYTKACVFDLCYYGSGNHMRCITLEAYAELCVWSACWSGEPAWDSVSAPSPSDEALTLWPASIPSSPADWNPSFLGRPQDLLLDMVTQISHQNQGPSQPFLNLPSTSLHLILSCLHCSSHATIFK